MVELIANATGSYLRIAKASEAMVNGSYRQVSADALPRRRQAAPRPNLTLPQAV